MITVLHRAALCKWIWRLQKCISMSCGNTSVTFKYIPSQSPSHCCGPAWPVINVRAEQLPQDKRVEGRRARRGRRGLVSKCQDASRSPGVINIMCTTDKHRQAESSRSSEGNRSHSDSCSENMTDYYDQDQSNIPWEMWQSQIPRSAYLPGYAVFFFFREVSWEYVWYFLHKNKLKCCKHNVLWQNR